jgi:hypothetical protein
MLKHGPLRWEAKQNWGNTCVISEKYLIKNKRNRITNGIFGEEIGIHNFKWNNYTDSNMQRKAYGTMRTRWFNKLL